MGFRGGGPERVKKHQVITGADAPVPTGPFVATFAAIYAAVAASDWASISKGGLSLFSPALKWP